MRRLLVALGILVLAAVAAAAQERAYVRFDDPALRGDSDDPAHTDWIDAFSVTGAVDVPPPSGGGGGGGAAPQVGPIVFTKPLDRATFGLVHRMAEGRRFPVVDVDICHEPVGGGQTCDFRIELTDAVITDVDLGGSTCLEGTDCASAFSEVVTLRFRRITWRFTAPGGGTVEASWDVPLATP